MSESAIRTSIKEALTGITGIGRVHDYERWSVDPAQFLTLFQDAASRKIFGWEITRTGAKVEKPTQKFKVTHNYVLKGYYGVQDAAGSEKLFNLVIETIVSKFISTQLAGTQGICLPQVGIIEFRMFGNNVLCHYAEVRLDVAEIVERVSDEQLTDLLKVGLDYYLKPGDDAADATDTVNLPL